MKIEIDYNEAPEGLRPKHYVNEIKITGRNGDVRIIKPKKIVTDELSSILKGFADSDVVAFELSYYCSDVEVLHELKNDNEK